jgi:hypothetical protein
MKTTKDPVRPIFLKLPSSMLLRLEEEKAKSKKKKTSILREWITKGWLYDSMLDELLALREEMKILKSNLEFAEACLSKGLQPGKNDKK